MAITRTPIVDDDGSGETGTAIDNAWKQEFYDQIDAVTAPIASPRVAIDPATLVFAGGWTVTPAQFPLCEYVRHGIEVHVRITISGGTVNAGADTTLQLLGLPFSAVGPSINLAALTNLTATGWGVCMAIPSGNSITLQRCDFAAWPAGAAYFFLDLLYPAS